MAKLQITYVVVFLVVLVCFTTYSYTFVRRNELIFQPEMDRRWTDISELFVPHGQKYSEKEGIIYDCFSAGVYQTVNAPAEVRNFTLDATIEKAVEDADKRQEKMSQHFGKPQLNKTIGFQTSGTGSTLQAAQAPLALLNSLIDRLKIYYKKSVITMVDIPCGDFYWMRELVGRRSDLHYTGFDIVPAIIDRHTKDYAGMKNAHFENVDIVKTSLDRSFDIVFSRDMLQHLSNADALKVLKHFSASGSKLLVTTNLLSTSNSDLGGARYRHLNLMLPPMNLVPPMCSIPDRISNGLKDLAVWELPLKRQG